MKKRKMENPGKFDVGKSNKNPNSKFNKSKEKNWKKPLI